MATRLREVDVVIVGLGWTGGILAKELSEAGMRVVALERGGMRSTNPDFAIPLIRDELKYAVRNALMQNPALAMHYVQARIRPRVTSDIAHYEYATR